MKKIWILLVVSVFLNFALGLDLFLKREKVNSFKRNQDCIQYRGAIEKDLAENYTFELDDVNRVRSTFESLFFSPVTNSCLFSYEYSAMLKSSWCSVYVLKDYFTSEELLSNRGCMDDASEKKTPFQAKAEFDESLKDYK